MFDDDDEFMENIGLAQKSVGQAETIHYILERND